MTRHIHVHIHDSEESKHDPKNGQFTGSGSSGGSGEKTNLQKNDERAASGIRSDGAKASTMAGSAKNEKAKKLFQEAAGHFERAAQLTESGKSSSGYMVVKKARLALEAGKRENK